MGDSRLLVVTSVPAERDALQAGLPSHVPVLVGGVGIAAAAAATARALAEAAVAGRPYALVISAGIAGGFAGRVHIGGTVLAARSIAADLGAQSPEDFLDLNRLDLGPSVLECDGRAVAALQAALPRAVVGDVLTVATVTGTAERADQLGRRWPGAVAEAMEGFGVATAAAQASVGFAELRTITNAVGPRDRGSWRVGDALAALTAAAAALGSLAG